MAGTLAFNATFGGGVTVQNGGTLGGTGTLSNVTLAAGAIVAPGNSIGTLNVAGNLDFGAGTFLDIEVDANGNADRVHATGTINIDAGATLRAGPETTSENGST